MPKYTVTWTQQVHHRAVIESDLELDEFEDEVFGLVVEIYADPDTAYEDELEDSIEIEVEEID